MEEKSYLTTSTINMEQNDKLRQLIADEMNNSPLMAIVRALPDRLVLQRALQILDGRNIQLGRTNGTSFGSQPSQKLSFYGVTPVIQHVNIAHASATTASNTAQLNLVIDALVAIGILSS